MPTGKSKNGRYRCAVPGCKYTGKSATNVKQHRAVQHPSKGVRRARAVAALPTTKRTYTRRPHEGINYCPSCGTSVRGWRRG